MKGSDTISETVAELEQLYKHIDSEVADQVAKHPIQCKAGCYGCCHLLAMVALSDGVLIAERLLSGEMGPLEPWLTRIVEHAWATLGADHRGLTTLDYMKRRHPCSFLDPTTKLCAVYDRRPLACRTHFVVSDPKLCSPDNETERIATVDTLEVELWLYEAIPANKTNGIPVAAPIPIMVLFALRMIAQQRKSFVLLRKLEEAANGIPDPLEYIARSHEVTDKSLTQLLQDRGYLK